MKRKKREKVYIVPTIYGFIFSSGAFACWLGALFYSNNLAYLLCFFLIIIFIIGMIQANNNLKGLSLVKVMAQPFSSHTAHENMGLLLFKSESSVSHVRLNIEGRVGANKKAVFSHYNVAEAGSLFSCKLSANPLSRGVHLLNRIKVYSRYPFGLFYVWRFYNVSHELVVHPRPSGHAPLPAMKQEGYYQEDSFSREMGENFHDRKAYEYGDSIRRVDWKAYARHKPLLTKIYDEGNRGALSLNLADAPDDFEKAIQQLCQWSLLCEKSKVKYEVIAGDHSVPLGGGKKHKYQVMKLLSQLEKTV